ncbi:hypothetical protein HYH03_014208 [Edaphochlamys debaryana]|uniref:MYND-type domain-containing protein n=1 Tax=Edaphochlamys debaryana TaxID=47281 RepID=A0A835XP70_9CHLO|nr:hypothetical protein HYH03_014208 [Edaphochlamys debaryana]|eukprot:KAG2487095.1 hypothetical protein HYH03_014208 [Edaphochlamys debaryana]
MAAPADGGVPPEARPALESLVRTWGRYAVGERAPELGDDVGDALAAFTHVVGTLAVEQLAVASPHKDLALYASSTRGTASLPQLAVEAGVVASATAALQAAARQAGGEGAPLAARVAHSALAVLCRGATSAAAERVAAAAEPGAGGSGDPLDGFVIMSPDGTTRPAVFRTMDGRPVQRPRPAQRRQTAATASAAAAAAAASNLAAAASLTSQLRAPALVEAVAAAVRALSAADSGGGGSLPSTSPERSLPLWRVLDRAAHLAHGLLWGMHLDLQSDEIRTARSSSYRAVDGQQDPDLARRLWPPTPPAVAALLASFHDSGLLEVIAEAMLAAPAPAPAPGSTPAPRPAAAPGRRQQRSGRDGGPAAEVGQAIANFSRALEFVPVLVKHTTAPGRDSTRQPSPEGLRALRLLLGPAVQRLQRCSLERHCTDAEAAAAGSGGGAGGGGGSGSSASGGSGGGSGWAALDACRLPPDEGVPDRVDISLPLPRPARGPDHMPLSLMALRTWGVCAQLDLLGPPPPPAEISSGAAAGSNAGQEPRPPPVGAVLDCTLRVLRAGPGADATLSSRRDRIKDISWLLHLILLRPAARPAFADEACALAALGATVQGLAEAVATAEYARTHHPLALMDDERVADVLHIAEAAEIALLAKSLGDFLPGPGTPLRVLRLPEARARVARLLAEARWAHTLEAALRLTAGAQPVMRMGAAGARASFMNMTGPGGTGTTLLQTSGSTADLARLQAAVQQLGPNPTPEAVAQLLRSVGGGGGGDDEGPPGQADRALLHLLNMAIALPSPAVALLHAPQPGPSLEPPAAGDLVTETLAQDLCGLLATLGKVARRLAGKAAEEVAAGRGLEDRPPGPATVRLEKAVWAVGCLLGALAPRRRDGEGAEPASAPAERSVGGPGEGGGGSEQPAPPVGPPVGALGLSSAAAAELRGAAALSLRACVRATTVLMEALAARAAAAEAAAAAAAAPTAASRRRRGGGQALGSSGEGRDCTLGDALSATVLLLASPLTGWGAVPEGLVPAAPERLISAACRALPAIRGTLAGATSAFGREGAVGHARILGGNVLCGLLFLAADPALGAEAAAWVRSAVAPPPPAPGGGSSGSATGADDLGILVRPLLVAAKWLQSFGLEHIVAECLRVCSTLAAAYYGPEEARNEARSCLAALRGDAHAPPPPDWVAALVPEGAGGGPAEAGAGGGVTWRLPKACCNPACTRLDGPWESALPLALCGGCRAVRYCKDGGCQREAWRGGHKGVCGALAAGRRREGAQAAAEPAGAQE